MHLYDAIEEYNFTHGKHFDTATGQYDLLMPHDLGRPLTHEEMDYNSWQEGKNGIAGSPTYAMITSRSHHVGLVQSALVDGSVRSITDSIDRKVWHALGTRAGREVIAAGDL